MTRFGSRLEGLRDDDKRTAPPQATNTFTVHIGLMRGLNQQALSDATATLDGVASKAQNAIRVDLQVSARWSTRNQGGLKVEESVAPKEGLACNQAAHHRFSLMPLSRGPGSAPDFLGWAPQFISCWNLTWRRGVI